MVFTVPCKGIVDETAVPGVGTYGSDEGPVVLYTPVLSTYILIFPFTGEGGVNSKNGSPESPKRRKYTDILKNEINVYN